ncbi:MAG: hypothetical protein RIG68_14530 [Imperialibacter sp.]|uniref:hypothetical protein n=1 Tax=Imperialibacter sp. TaxID=2038411 RepID=UPI0032F01A3A
MTIDTWTIVKIIGGIIGTISISGAVIWWFVQLAANTLADSYKKKIEHDFEKKIEAYKSQLEILKATSLKYNDRQFELYIDLWKNLQDLKFACIDLWNHANSTNLRKFEAALMKTHRQVETTSILLEENHYKELIEIIDNLQEFDTGKEKLIAARRLEIDECTIQQIIEFNRIKKDRCLQIIEAMKSDIKWTIKGQN